MDCTLAQWVSLELLDRSLRNLCADACACGTVLLQRCWYTLFTCGFMDDVTFGHSGLDGDTWRPHIAVTTASGVAIPGRSLMSMNALLMIFNRAESCLVFCPLKLSWNRQCNTRATCRAFQQHADYCGCVGDRITSWVIVGNSQRNVSLSWRCSTADHTVHWWTDGATSSVTALKYDRLFS